VQDERIVMANPCARRLFGATAREVSEAHYLDYTWPEDRPLIAARTRARLAGERLSETVTYRLRTAAGQPVPVEAHATLIQWEGGTASLIFLTNIEERVRAEEERARLQDSLQESRRLEAIGLLAGGVAHDFNNMLAAILGYAELARDALPEGSGPRSDLDEIVAAAGRSRDLVRQLLAFASRQTLQMATLDLNAVVSGLAPMLRRTLREDVRIRLDLADSLPAIQGDRGQIEQVLLNLAVNAQDAMPGGGELVIETVEETPDNGCASERSGILSGRFVVMKVSDTGSGMDAETLERAFEPFFTTKGQGKGTGLGLPTVYGIMKQHQGSITAASAPGKGSVFLARFPACSDAAPAEARSKPRDPVRGAETVLVVEDQGQTRRLVCEMLRRNGYRVLEAADGESALAVAGTHDGEIDLVVTDVVMAGMNGKQLVERLREARPRTRVLFMSGYTSDIIGHHGVLEPGVQFIQKPFRLQDFTAKMREVLDRPGA
jgi:PAS domain S-box-containing protein